MIKKLITLLMILASAAMFAEEQTIEGLYQEMKEQEKTFKDLAVKACIHFADDKGGSVSLREILTAELVDLKAYKYLGEVAINEKGCLKLYNRGVNALGIAGDYSAQLDNLKGGELDAESYLLNQMKNATCVAGIYQLASARCRLLWLEQP